MYRSSINKQVFTPIDCELVLVPISVASNVPEIIDLTHGTTPLNPGYYYILHSDILISPTADFLVVGEKFPGST